MAFVVNKKKKKKHKNKNKILKSVKAEEIGIITIKIQTRRRKLIDSITKSVFQCYPQHQNMFTFDIKEIVLQKMIRNITQVFSKWYHKNRHIGHIKEPITDRTETKHKIQMYWNKQKAPRLGNYLFSSVIASLFQYIMHGFDDNLSNKDKLILFIHIFERLLNEQVEFPIANCKCEPLILYECLSKQNQFKQFCNEFVYTFGLIVYEWSVVCGYIRRIENKYNIFIPTSIILISFQCFDCGLDNITRSKYGQKGLLKYTSISDDNKPKEVYKKFIDVLGNIKVGLKLYPGTTTKSRQKMNHFSMFIEHRLNIHWRTQVNETDLD